MTSSHFPMPPVFVRQCDLDRLNAVLDGHLADLFPEEAAALRFELDRACIMAPEALPPDVVTMHSRVEYIDLLSGRGASVTLVYPWEADAAKGRINILAPIATALLGLRVGSTIEWRAPSGRRFTLIVVRTEGGRVM